MDANSAPLILKHQVISIHSTDHIYSLYWSSFIQKFYIDSKHYYKVHVQNKYPGWNSNHMPNKVWDEITYPFLNFNGVAVEV